MALRSCQGLLLLWGLRALPAWSLTARAGQLDHREAQPAGGASCSCLPWRDVYESRGVVCGQALEYYFRTKSGLPWDRANQALGDEFCRRFFRRIPDSFCLNADLSDAETGLSSSQWCYVSPACASLNGGARILGANASWKLCRAGEDELLRDKSPEEIDGLRGSRNLALGLLAKFAYPIWQKDRWPAVEQEFLGAAEDMRADLKQIVASGRPMVFDSASGHPPFHVVVGEKVYRIDFTPMGHRAYAQGQMGSVTNLKCIQGAPTYGNF